MAKFFCRRPGCPHHHLHKPLGSDGYCCNRCKHNEGGHTANCTGDYNEGGRTKNCSGDRQYETPEKKPPPSKKRSQKEEIPETKKRSQQEEMPETNMKHARKRQRKDSSSSCEASSSETTHEEEIMMDEETLHKSFDTLGKQTNHSFQATLIRTNGKWGENKCEQAWTWPDILREYGCLRVNWIDHVVHDANWGRRLTIIATKIQYEKDLGFREQETLNVERKFSEKYDEADHEIVKQSGVCPDVMMNVWKHCDFNDAIAEAVCKIEEGQLEYLVVYCRHGTHRSVAMACLLNCLCYFNAQVVVTTKRTRADALTIGWQEVSRL